MNKIPALFLSALFSFHAIQLNSQVCFNPAVDYPTVGLPFCVCSADFNMDGKLDLALGDGGGNYVEILLGTGTGTFGTATTFTTGTSPWAIATADFNGDSKPDVVTANYFSN